MIEIEKYWSNIWSTPKQHNRNASWIKKEETLAENLEIMNTININQTDKRHHEKASQLKNTWNRPHPQLLV